MEFLPITSPEDYKIKDIYHSYSTTFPEDERRDWDQFVKLFSNPHVKVISVLHESKVIGYLIFWELSDYIFVEHFEVFAEFRSQKLGSHITGYLFKNYQGLFLKLNQPISGKMLRDDILFTRKTDSH